jgi:hypothetical protein
MHFSELMIGDSYCVENVGPAAEGSEQGRNVRLGVLVQKKMIAPHDRGAGSWQYVFSHRETFDDPERFTVCEVSPRDENALDIVCTDLAALDVIHKPTGPTAMQMLRNPALVANPPRQLALLSALRTPSRYWPLKEFYQSGDVLASPTAHHDTCLHHASSHETRMFVM